MSPGVALVLARVAAWIPAAGAFLQRSTDYRGRPSNVRGHRRCSSRYPTGNYATGDSLIGGPLLTGHVTSTGPRR